MEEQCIILTELFSAYRHNWVKTHLATGIWMATKSNDIDIFRQYRVIWAHFMMQFYLDFNQNLAERLWFEIFPYTSYKEAKKTDIQRTKIWKEAQWSPCVQNDAINKIQIVRILMSFFFLLLTIYFDLKFQRGNVWIFFLSHFSRSNNINTCPVHTYNYDEPVNRVPNRNQKIHFRTNLIYVNEFRKWWMCCMGLYSCLLFGEWCVYAYCDWCVQCSAQKSVYLQKNKIIYKFKYIPIKSNVTTADYSCLKLDA